MDISGKLMVTEILFGGIFGYLYVVTKDKKLSDFYSKMMDVSLAVAIITFLTILWRN